MDRRTLLGTKNGVAQRTRIYLAGDAIEVDEIEGYSGTRGRVLLDEIRVITIDRRRSTSALVWLGIGAVGLFASFALSIGTADAAAFGAGIASPLALLFIFHVVMGTDYVTVFGKRSNAAMSFTFRKAKARRTYEMLRERVTQVQEEARAKFAAEAPQDLPPPPSFGGGEQAG